MNEVQTNTKFNIYYYCYQIEKENIVKNKMVEFENWLTEKLTSLGTDASVFSPYIGK